MRRAVWIVGAALCLALSCGLDAFGAEPVSQEPAEGTRLAVGPDAAFCGDGAQESRIAPAEDDAASSGAALSPDGQAKCGKAGSAADGEADRAPGSRFPEAAIPDGDADKTGLGPSGSADGRAEGSASAPEADGAQDGAQDGGGQGALSDAGAASDAGVPEASLPERVEDGAYIIESGYGTVLDIEGASSQDGGNAWTFDGNYSYAQRFRIEAAGQASSGEWFYTIESVNSGKVLDCANGGTQSGTNVQQFQENGTAAQQWFLRKVETVSGERYYEIVSVKSGLALDVQDGNSHAGANVQIFSPNNTVAQRWRLVACRPVIEDGAYVIESSLGGGLVVDIDQASGINGAPAQLYQGNGTNAQAFALNYDERTGYYTITNYNSGRVVDVADGSAAAGTGLQQFAGNGTRAQKWHVVVNDDGSVTFVSAICGYVMDVSDGAARNGARLQQFYWNGTAAQRFYLRATTPTFAGGVVSVKPGADLSLLVDVRDGRTSPGALAQVQTYNAGFAQKFDFASVGQGLFTIAALNSGLFLSIGPDGSLSFEPASESICQQWLVAPTLDGRFLIVSGSAGLALGLYDGAAPLALVSAREGGSYGWNMVRVPLVAEGYYVINSSGDPSLALDVEGASLNNRANIWAHYDNGTKAQVFYIRNLGSDVCQIFNAWSLLAFDVENSSAAPGANIQQYANKGLSGQKWQIVWDGAGGFAFKSLLGDVALSLSSLAPGANAELAAFDIAAQNQRFTLEGSEGLVLSFEDRLLVLDSLSTEGLTVFRSMNGLSAERIDALWNAIGNYGGADLGFIMMDLKSGAGVAYNIDEMFFSASTIKGPYVVALNKYYPWALGSWEEVMSETIHTSNNDTYAELREAFGVDPIERFVSDTGAWGFDYAPHYVTYSARQLAKLWVGMGDYLEGDYQNSWWARDAFDDNLAITSRPSLCWRYDTIYAKSGWVTDIHNEGCIVMAGDHPYLMVVMSAVDHTDDWLMGTLMQELDYAHDELV